MDIKLYAHTNLFYMLVLQRTHLKIVDTNIDTCSNTKATQTQRSFRNMYGVLKRLLFLTQFYLEKSSKHTKTGNKTCNICLTEKYHIIMSPLTLLNKRSELISKCHHSNKYYRINFKAVPLEHT